MVHRFVLVFFWCQYSCPHLHSHISDRSEVTPCSVLVFFVIYLKYNRLFIVDTGRRQVFSSDLSKTPVK